MSTLTLLSLSVSLAMDAFAVSVSNGTCFRKINIKHILLFGLYFGTFQFLMPLLGFLLGSTFAQYIEKYDHWIIFIVLGIIGVMMIKESFAPDDENSQREEDILKWKNMVSMAIATSIDAFAVGVTFSTQRVNVLLSSVIIGIIAFIFSAVGVGLGKKIGDMFKSNAERFGGAVLIFIGIKTLIEHLS